MSSVYAETIVNLTKFEHFCLIAVSLHLFFYYKYMHAKGIFFSNSSLSTPCQIKYKEPGIIRTFVHRFLLHQGTSVVKLKHWYFLLVSRNFHYESVLAVIMPERNGNSVANIAVARVESSEPV